MESTSLSSKNETPVAFRIAAKHVEDFKRMAQVYHKKGDIKISTLSALGYHTYVHAVQKMIESFHTIS